MADVVTRIMFARVLAVMAIVFAAAERPAHAFTYIVPIADEEPADEGQMAPDQGDGGSELTVPNEDNTVPMPALPVPDEQPGCPLRGQPLELLV